MKTWYIFEAIVMYVAGIAVIYENSIANPTRMVSSV